jgi:hypothetical protein
MKITLERTFDLAAPADAAWALLRDVEAVAACMPGARVTERVDDRHYKGTVAMKLGPASLLFKGQVEVLALDEATRTLKLAGKGTDAGGGSGAAMDLTARVEGVDGSTCRLLGTSEVSMSGKAAAFGSRMMNPVAEQLLAQFAVNYAARLKERQEASTAAPAPAVASAPAAAPAMPLDGLALLWAVFKGWLRSLFGR